MKGMFKWPFAIAAFLVVARIVCEQRGMPETVNNLFSVVVLYVFIAPMYFALKIAKTDNPKPYAAELKSAALFTLLTRGLLVIPTYWLAYVYHWRAPRFSVAQGGVVGPGIEPLRAFVVTPLAALVVWILASVIIGGGI